MTSIFQQKSTLCFIKILLFYFGILGSLAFGLLSDEQNNIDVYQKCNPAVVNITATTLRRDFFFDIVPQRGLGSGAVFRPDGYIVTNDHVIGDAQDVEVTLFDKSNYPAKVIGADPDSDIAVLKINPQGKKLSAIDFNLSGLSVGQKVLAIGNPFGLGGSLSIGVISSLGRDIRTPTDRLLKDVIQTDAAINPGNSGGPLLDSSGKLIGINAQIVTRSGGSEGIGFAINVKTVKRIVDQLIQFGRVLRPDLGIYGVGLDQKVLNYLKIESPAGVMVTQLLRGSSGLKAGLKPATRELVVGFYRIPIDGDVIVQIDSSPVGSIRDILDYIGDKKIGDTVTLHYFRNHVKKTVTVKLQAGAVNHNGEESL